MPAILITVTVESDRPRGEIPARTALKNLDGVHRLQRLCERYGVTPTWLLTYPAVARTPEPLLADAWAAGRCEIGACLQPWVSPPFGTGEDRLTAVGPHRIPASAVDAKLGQLVETIRERYGRAPTAHRAPRGGLGGAVLQALERLGFVADSSARPYHDDRPNGLDWREAPEIPYYPDRQRPDQRGASPVLQVPVNACWSQPLPEAVARGLSRVPPDSALGRLTRRVIRPRTLDPLAADQDGLREAVRAMRERGHPALNVALRSHELVAGQSKRCPRASDASRLFDNLEVLVRYAVDQLQMRPQTLSQFAAAYSDLGGPAT